MDGDVEKIFSMLAEGIDPGKINPELVEKALDECLGGDEEIEKITRLIIRGNHRLVISLNKAEEALHTLLRALPIDSSRSNRNIWAAFHIIESCKEILLQKKNRLQILCLATVVTK